ncbi:MAG: S8 family serine peptidase [Gaiellaceae bacterium]
MRTPLALALVCVFGTWTGALAAAASATTRAAGSPTPFAASEWWLTAIGAAGLDPPGPGKPVTVIDSGVDVTHPEFAGRANLEILNTQSTDARNEDHGTEVASIIGAPGAGMIGVYPQAVLRVWDASPGQSIITSEAILGLQSAAAAGPGVINLSWGSTGRDPGLEQAIDGDVRAGLVVVAAAGNDRANGSPVVYPASLPHVLTVGGTDEQGRITDFSSASPGMDLLAPGQDIAVADPVSFGGYTLADGTSFSAPIVAGAAAWLWTARPDLDASQITELLRRTATDVAPPGWDPDSGFGRLDLQAALAAPAPQPDPQEPNEDIRFVRPNAVFQAGEPTLTSPVSSHTMLAGRLDGVDDPRDVYRLWIPARGTVRVAARADDGAPLATSLWGPRTSSVGETGASRRRDLLARGPGTATTRGGKAGSIGYVALEVVPGRRISYTLSVKTAAAP